MGWWGYAKRQEFLVVWYIWGLRLFRKLPPLVITRSGSGAEGVKAQPVLPGASFPDLAQAANHVPA
eukprot:3089625-Pyramimonas_sp.AAC.1